MFFCYNGLMGKILLKGKNSFLILTCASAVLVIGFVVPLTVRGQTKELQISVETIVGHPTPPPVPPTSTIEYLTPGGIFPKTVVLLKGRAYPHSFVTILKDGEVTATLFAEESGFFEREISGLESGHYSFGIWGEDEKGRKSVTINFSLDILKWTKTTVSGIFLSPTMEIQPSSVERGENIEVFGQSFPHSRINILIFPEGIVRTTLTGTDGNWSYLLNTFFLDTGSYTIKAKAESEMGIQSDFSYPLSFSVIPRGTITCWGPDLNFDGRVNVVDLGILMYFWGQDNPQNHCANINTEGKVDVYDFSLMMYWWTD